MVQNKAESRRVLYETLIILGVTFVGQFVWPNLRLLFALVPTVYLFAERYLRRRTWAEMGFDIRALPRAIVDNALLIVWVGFIIQVLVVWTTKTWLPAFLDHVLARFPLTLAEITRYLPVLLVGALWEEINYRALFQARLSRFIPVPVAIGLVSIVFGIGHWAPGEPHIVMLDILLVTLDGVVYGVIFARSHNIYVAWLAHFLANLLAIGFLLLL